MIMDYPLWMLWSMECSIYGVKIKKMMDLQREKLEK